jgi:copper resistance protein C
MSLWRTLLVTVVAFVAVATPASAHVRLLASSPEPGQALTAPPQSIRLTFDDGLSKAPVITITDPNGTEWPVGQPSMDGKAVTVAVDPRQGPPGQYTVGYRVTGADGHLVPGEVKFTITAAFGQPAGVPEGSGSQPPATAEPTHADHTGHAETTASSTSDSGGIPPWIWIVGAVIIVGAFFAFTRRGKKSA